jgi:hypothetical protein
LRSLRFISSFFTLDSLCPRSPATVVSLRDRRPSHPYKRHFFSTSAGFKTQESRSDTGISQLRSGWARAQGSCASWRDAGVPPSRQDGFGFATTPRHVVPG